MKHTASRDFWLLLDNLPPSIRSRARKNFTLLKNNPNHPSLNFKKIGHLRSVRVGLQYRALGVDIRGGVLWFWVGSHGDYDKLLSRL